MDPAALRLCFPDADHRPTCSDDLACLGHYYCAPDGACHIDDRAGCDICATCEEDVDCLAVEICTDFGGFGGRRCFRRCAEDVDCPGDAVCREVIPQQFYCASAESGPLGEPCNYSYSCTVPCRVDLPCAAGEVCVEKRCEPAAEQDPAPQEGLGCTCAAPGPAASVLLPLLGAVALGWRRRAQLSSNARAGLPERRDPAT